MKYLNYLIVTKNGLVGDLIYKTSYDGKEYYIARFPKSSSVNVILSEDEADIVRKDIIPKNTKFI